MGGAVIAAGVSLLTGSTISAFVTKLAVSAALNFVAGKLLSPNKSGLRQKSRELQVVIREAAAAHRLVYGQTLVGGVLRFAAESGGKNEFIHLVAIFAAHEVEAIGETYFDDKTESEKDAAFFTIRKYFGTDTQLADATIVAAVTEWTDAHRLLGRAYNAYDLKWDKDFEQWPLGLPNIRCIIDGKNDILDPRDNSTGYTTNWALCAADVLQRLFPGATINQEWLIVSANISDEDVTVPAVGGGTTTQKRYTMNGVVDTADGRFDILNQVESAGAGLIFKRNGEWIIQAGHYIVPTETITDDDVIGDLTFSTAKDLTQRYNTVQATYIDAAKDYRARPTREIKIAEFIAEDNGNEYKMPLQLPFTNDDAAAQRIALLMLKRSRSSRQITVVLGYSAMPRVQLGDNINVDFQTLGITGVYRVVERDIGVGPDSEPLRVVLQEDKPEYYTFETTDIELVDAGTLPTIGGDIPAPTSLVVTSTLNILGTLSVDWTESTSEFVDRYEVQWKKTTDTDYASQFVSAPPAIIQGVEKGVTYDVRVRALAAQGKKSGFTSTTHTVTSTGTEAVTTGEIGTTVQGFFTTTSNISTGSADSGGGGHRVLRVPNSVTIP